MVLVIRIRAETGRLIKVKGRMALTSSVLEKSVLLKTNMLIKKNREAKQKFIKKMAGIVYASPTTSIR